MTTNDFKFDPKAIKPADHTPLVSTLLSLIDQLTLQLSQQAESLASQSKKIDELLSEIRQLKKLSKKPKLRASTLPKDKDDKEITGASFWTYIKSLYPTPTPSSVRYSAIITQTTFGVGYRYFGRTIKSSSG